MKPLCKALVSCLFCLVLCSCAPETDFVIPKETMEQTNSEYEENKGIFVVINKNSDKYHLDADCVYAIRMSESNRLEIKVKNEEYLRENGYTPCAKCSCEK